jgi:hypothetical protein
LGDDVLTQADLHQLFSYDPETGVLTRRSTGRRAGSLNTCRNRWIVSCNGRLQYQHRVIWCMVYGEWPSNEVDHVNGDSADNRLANLRLADSAQNKWNMRRHDRNTSGCTGVDYNKQKQAWVARISIYKKRIYLGKFETKEQAIAAREKAVLDHWGAYRRGGVSSV